MGACRPARNAGHELGPWLTAAAAFPPPPPPAAAAPPSPTSLVDGWADAVVREMAVATDVADARDRAAVVLRGFAASLAGAADAGRGSGGAGPSAAARAAALERDCGLLKRAVALQAARLADAATLRSQLEAAQGRVHALELANYGLAAHLRAAAGGAGSVLGPGPGQGGGGGGGPDGGGSHPHHGQPPPDVY